MLRATVWMLRATMWMLRATTAFRFPGDAAGDGGELGQHSRGGAGDGARRRARGGHQEGVLQAQAQEGRQLARQPPGV
eukprot:8598657-Pyramimonas_sp.AAC.1